MTRTCGHARVAGGTRRLAKMLCSGFVLTQAYGCTGETVGAALVTTGRDSADVRIIEHSKTALDESTTLRLAARAMFRLGAQTGAPEVLFTSIKGAVRLPDRSFAILDGGSRDLRVFDANGKFVRRIGRQGSGPGELEDPVRLSLGADTTLVVWDRRARRVSWYKPDGRFVRSEALPASTVSVLASLSDGNLLAVLDESPRTAGMPSGGRKQNAGRIVRLDSDGGLSTKATFPGTEWFMRVSPQGVQIQQPWFAPRLLATVTPGGVWAANGTRWEVTRRSVGGRVDRILRIQVPPERLTGTLIQEIKASELAATEHPEARQALERYHQEVQYPATVPPVGDLFADAAGRLWIGVLQPPVVNLPSGMGRAIRQWAILANEGTQALGTVSLPPGRRPLLADRDGVLLVTVDDEDVPYVEWWPFTAR